MLLSSLPTQTVAAGNAREVPYVIMSVNSEEWIMKHIFLIVLATISTSILAQSPVISTYAYSRSTIPGIPEDGSAGSSPKNVFPTSYFIYVVVKKGTVLSVSRVWVKGKCYAAALQKVDSPVLIEHDAAVPTGKTDTLVGKTSDDVYHVVLAEAKSRNANDDAAKGLKRDNEVVVFLKAGQSTYYGKARTIRALQPAAAM